MLRLLTKFWRYSGLVLPSSTDSPLSMYEYIVFISYLFLSWLQKKKLKQLLV